MKLRNLSAAAVAVISIALLAGCSKADKDIEDDVEKLSKLAPSTQVAYALRTPLCIFGFAAIAWAINGVKPHQLQGQVMTANTRLAGSPKESGPSVGSAGSKS